MKRLRKMIHSASFFCLCLSLLTGVFGERDEVKLVSVNERDSVSLNTDVTEVQRDDQILWTFGPKETRIAEIHRQNLYIDATNTIFENRVQIDNQTGSLTVRNIRSEHSGLYKLQIMNKERGTSHKRFNVSVYAALPVPDIIRHTSNCSSSSSSSSSSSVSNCSVLCSVVNVSAVTLSWYKGNSLLSSISVSDLSISLSLPLEIECLEDSYSCVVAYSFTNKTKHLNNTDLCRPCPERGESLCLISIVVIALLLLLLAVAAGLIYCYRKHKLLGKEDKAHEEEILYADTTFCSYRVKRTDVAAADQTLYSTVKT